MMKRTMIWMVAALGLGLGAGFVGGCDDDDDNNDAADAGNGAAAAGCGWSYALDVNDPDAISGASGMFVYENAFYDAKKMGETLSLLTMGADNRTPEQETLARTIVLVLATVREDGSPNIASIMPGMVNDEVMVFFNMGSITKDSIKASKFARAYFRVYDAAGKNQYDDIGSGGNRMLLQLIEDPAEIEALHESYMANNPEYADSNLGTDMFLYMRIVDIYPIG